MNILIGLGIVVIGILIMVFRHWITNTFGFIAWAEGRISGGTYALWSYIGIAVIVIGLLTATNLIQGIILSTVGGLFGADR